MAAKASNSCNCILLNIFKTIHYSPRSGVSNPNFREPDTQKA